MTETVTTAIYRMGVEGTEEVVTATGAVDQLGAAEGRLSVSQEKVTRATRTSADAMDKLLGRLDPRIRAEQQLQAALAQISRLEEEGVGSTAQRATAVAAATERYNAAIQRVKGTNAEGTFLGAANAAKLSAFQIQNMSFQMQDVGQAVLTGQPLFTTLIQQGSQIAQIFGPGVGVAGAMKAVGTGIVSFVTNPLNLAVLAFASAAAGAQALFSLLGGGSASGTLQKHEDAIKEIKAAWDGAGDSVDRYGPRVQGAIEFAGRADFSRLSSQLNSQITDIFSRASSYQDAGAGIFTDGPFTKVIKDLGNDFRAGTVDVLEFNDAIREIANNDPTNRSLQGIAAELLNITDDATKTAEAIKELNDELKEMTTPRSPGFADAQRAIEYMNKNKDALIDFKREHAAAMEAIGATSPSELAQVARSRVLAEPVDPMESTQVRQFRADAAAALALAQAEHGLSEAARERARAYDETIASTQLDLDLIGKSTVEIERLRLEYTLTAKVRQEAAKNGIAVDQAELALIRAKAAEYSNLRQAISETNQLRDLQFAQGQITRSPSERTVASTLRGMYGDDWEQHADGAIAKQIRFNQSLEQAVSLSKDFVGTFRSELEKGASVIDALTAAVGRFGDKLVDIALDQAINGLFQNVAGGLFSNVFGGAPAASSVPTPRLRPFAAGGVVATPTIFPMANGAGLMGEAGPEAIMPLKRGPGGRLGVEAAPAAPATGTSVVFSPTTHIDARGAGKGVAEEIKAALDARDRNFETRLPQLLARQRSHGLA